MTDTARLVEQARRNFAYEPRSHVVHLLVDEVERLNGERDVLREAAQAVADAYTAWSEDHNDGSYAYWRNDDLMVACVNLRDAVERLPAVEDEGR